MKKLLRAAIALVLCLLLSACAAAQEEAGVPEALEPLRGTLTWPEESGVSLTYALPQFDAQTQSDAAINAYYQAMAQALAAAAPQEGEEELVELDYEIAHLSERYVSVALYRYELGGVTETQTMTADTFARDGVYAGRPVSLSEVLGLEEDAEAEAESAAEALAVDLVWQIVWRDSQNMDRDYLEGLTRERIAAAFCPETDFYLDADGNIVFFVQAGVIAAEVAGILRYPFSPAEMLSALAAQP